MRLWKKTSEVTQTHVIAVDGLEGAGKSMVLAALAADPNLPLAKFTRVFGDSCAPWIGGASLARSLYEASLESRYRLDETSQQLALGLSARIHYRESLARLRDFGGLVLSHRSALSVLAYAHAVGPHAFAMARWALDGVQVEDAVILLDLPPEYSVARRQAKAPPISNDVTLLRSLEFQANVREGFVVAEQCLGIEARRIDATMSPREVIRLVTAEIARSRPAEG
jgi:thymidylate kinase